MTSYAPGTVQVVLSLHPSRVQELATWCIRNASVPSLLRDVGEQIKAQGHGKRLVAIDPEDREQVERLIRLQDKHFNRGERETVHADDLRDMQAALRSLLTSPKPEEPKGFGAVVEDAEGTRWIRTCDPCERCLDKPWQHGGMHAHWQRVAAVRVLSAGIGEAE